MGVKAGDGFAAGSFQLGSNSAGAQQLPSAWSLGLDFSIIVGGSDRPPESILPVALSSHSFKTVQEPSEKGQLKQHPRYNPAHHHSSHPPNGHSQNVLLEVNSQLLFKYISKKKKFQHYLNMKLALATMNTS